MGSSLAHVWPVRVSLGVHERAQTLTPNVCGAEFRIVPVGLAIY